MQVGLAELILCMASSALAGLAGGWRFRHSSAEADAGALQLQMEAATNEAAQHLAQEIAVRQKAVAQMEAATTMAGDLRKELDRVRKEYAAIEPQMQKLRQSMKAQELEMCELLASKMELSQQLEAHAAQVASLACGFGEIEELKRGLADREERLAAYDDRYQILLGEMHAEIGILRARVQEMEPMLADAGDREGRLIEVQEQHAKVLREKEAEIARLRFELRRPG